MIWLKAYPCKDCYERHIGCHGSCERYQAEAAKNRDIAAKRDTKGEVDFIDFKTRTIAAAKRRKR